MAKVAFKYQVEIRMFIHTYITEKKLLYTEVIVDQVLHGFQDAPYNNYQRAYSAVRYVVDELIKKQALHQDKEGFQSG